MRRRERGQVLVLGVGSLLVMALSLMISFNVGNAVHERIRLQAASDSLAYSLGVLEARALNSVAHINRSIAATLTAEMSLHVYAAIVLHLADQLDQSAYAFEVIAAMEYARSFDGTKVPCVEPVHCVHSSTAQDIADEYRKEAKRVRNAGDGAEGDWRTAVRSLQAMTNGLARDQEAIIWWTMAQLDGASPDSVFNKLKEHNAPFATNTHNLAGKPSRLEFACALEGNGADGQRFGEGCSYRYKPNRQRPTEARYKDRDQVMANVVYGARPNLLIGADGWSARPAHLADMQYTNGPYKRGSIINPERMMEIQGSGLWQYDPLLQSRAYLRERGDEAVGTDLVGAHLVGELTIQWGHPNQVIGGWQGLVDSAPVESHRGGPNGFEGVSCRDRNACFVSFNLTDEREWAYNQPSVYGGMQQPLKLMGRANTQRPWELNADGAATVKVGDTKWNLVMAPQGDAFAASKAKVYFHQLGNWNVPPNSFDPLWRAKLHPFERSEATEALKDFGPEAGSEIARSLVPIEGADQEAVH